VDFKFFIKFRKISTIISSYIFCLHSLPLKFKLHNWKAALSCPNKIWFDCLHSSKIHFGTYPPSETTLTGGDVRRALGHEVSTLMDGVSEPF
jgi:hypothetical protein